ncbi:MAG: hypothetical protein A4E71_02925 [Smithella sp. PtaU1.Bin162]|nr:MAG: hypothetical protein A4E71_02925 [Smithella sp. PtaU1.Bin162]
MKNMSFALTTKQIIDGTKTVTRRLGWLNLKPGELVRPVKKCMGLKKGESIEALRDPIRIVSVRREPLINILIDLDYGLNEIEKEGFSDHPVYRWPSVFVEFFCATHKGCTPETIITRIEFEYPDSLVKEAACKR